MILMTSDVYVSDQNRKPEGSKSVPGTNGRFSPSSTESPTDGTFSFGFISKQPRLALYSAFDSAPAQAGTTK